MKRKKKSLETIKDMLADIRVGDVLMNTRLGSCDVYVGKLTRRELMNIRGDVYDDCRTKFQNEILDAFIDLGVGVLTSIDLQFDIFEDDILLKGEL